MAHRKKQGKKNPKGFKKKDQIHGQKKGKKGEAAQYVTRAQALARLQVPLADFRKLCILKGIYPRDPKKKPAGMDKTYYHAKDIAFLAHEPLLAKFFDLKTFMKKFKKLMGRQEKDLAKRKEDNKPKYTLHHLVRERYGSFEDALRDLDDAVSMLALFQALSADQKRDIPTAAVNEATRLYQEFQLYVIRAQALRKVFASIKGYYFQAEIHGQTVTWLAPHQFAQELPPEVDFRVMLTFLEFYRAMLKFVNFKLYSELGLSYPPKRDWKKDNSAGEVAALEVEMREAGKAREAQAEQGEKEDAEVSATVAADFGAESAEALEMQKQVKEQTRMKTTFRGLRVFVNREVPLRPVYFVLLCGGVGEVGWERGAIADGGAGKGSAFQVSAKNITHQVIDRPAASLDMVQGREYIQPQWIFDSFNVGCQLPVALYAPGRAPPPHLSPFVDDEAEGYVPRQRELLDKLAQEAGVSGGGATADGEAGAEGAAGAAASGEKAEGTYDKFHEELKAEAKGVWHSEFKDKEAEDRKTRIKQLTEEAVGGKKKGAAGKKAAATASAKAEEEEEAEEAPAQPGPKPTEAEEERLRAKAMMPKKHKRLLSKIEHREQSKEDAKERLLKKRRKLEADERKAGGAA